MKDKRNILITIVGILLLVTVACNFSASTANIESAYTARMDNGEIQQTTVFTQEDVFLGIVDVANAPDDTVTKAMWYAVDAEGVEPNYFLAEAQVEGGGELTFDLSNNDMLWPAGKYKVEIYLNDELNQTLQFTVVGSLSAASVGDMAVAEESDSEVIEDEYLSSCGIESEFNAEWSTVVCDTFDDNFYGWYEGYDDTDLASIEVGLQNGKYVVDVVGKATSGYTGGVINWFDLANANNFVASVDGRIVSKNRGVTWGFNFWGDGDNFYSFTIGKEGQYFMDVLQDGSWKRVMNVKTSKAIDWDDATNNLTIVAEDGALTFYVNGTRVDTYKSEQQYGSLISLFFNVDEGASAKFYFDNVLVRTNDF